MFVTRHAQITQNNKVAISSQNLQKLVCDEVDLLHADKHEGLLHIDTMVLDGVRQAFPKFQKLQVWSINSKITLIFCMQINIKVS